MWILSLLVLSSCAVGDCDSSDDGGGGGGGGSYCCKVCEESKACGDSCIGTSQTCHKTGGCACNGFAPFFYEDVAE